MSILIKGMEMPTSCDSCRIMEFEDTNCVEEFYCGCPIVFKAHPQGVDHRPDYCPLIEVPEPHGRLIDENEMFGEFVIEGQRSKRYKLGEKWELNGEEIRSVISRLPTIIPASDEG